MADLSQAGLDPNVKENTGAFVVVPAGSYPVVIVGDRLVDNSKGTGKLLELKVQIIEGEHRGVTIIDRLNIVNASAQAQEIAQGTLRRICGLCNVPFPCPNTDGIIGKPMTATIKVDQFKSNKSDKMLDSNKIAAYNPYENAPVKEKAAAW